MIVIVVPANGHRQCHSVIVPLLCRYSGASFWVEPRRRKPLSLDYRTRAGLRGSHVTLRHVTPRLDDGWMTQEAMTLHMLVINGFM